ncbi:MAG: UDP-N-acetylglucosamine--N-acetylmuramyl-(pentapeptide) pyrophosphoryl-undecaprenol N-acetylglucosamine transferase [Chloroflexota bacterium]|nr:MAG: UDP-N-acetylglucosamine--N-acetylmuramyl-(pentapeptide) pyrophosphoryl-undecaprenol N-acetylglucosamine transferase [Chloroflexota bacterium]
MRVVITGGGTGGHVYPALAVASELVRGQLPAPIDGQESASASPGSGASSSPDHGAISARPSAEAAEIVYVGGYGMERQIVAQTPYRYVDVHSGALRGKSPPRMLLSIWALGLGFLEAVLLLHRLRPAVVLATGGFVCAPVVAAARLLRVPALIYLPDVVPGWAIRALSRISNAVAVTSIASRRYLPGARVVETGYPVRPEIGCMDRAEARRRLGLDAQASTLLVWGGSRGAHSLNKAVGDSLHNLLGLAQVLHISGERDWPWLEERRQNLPPAERTRYALHKYLHEDFPAALAAADLVVSRAGASVLGEFPAAGLPAILVPYPYAGAHQRQNAAVLAQCGAAVELDDDKLSNLVSLIASLLQDAGRLESMAASARAAARPQAARAIAGLALSLAGRAR